jgi:hypothetical protein
VSLIEAVISTAIIALTTASIFTGLSFGYYSSLRATCATEGVARVTRVLEDVAYIPYEALTTNQFPVQYVLTTNGTSISLAYALTTSIATVTAPIEYKTVRIDYTWRFRDHQRSVRYFTIKTP